jgi:micrococcal nuclease
VPRGSPTSSMARRCLAWVLFAALAGPAAAATIRGVVTHVTDGDTLWVRPATGGEAIEIRLLNLDAPEGCQRYGAEAKRALARRVLHQQVLVRTRGTDAYQRSLAQVRHRGEDVGGWLVRQGFAWSSGPRGQAGPYAKQEALARAARAGLWSQPDAQEPRKFRWRHGRCE